MKLILLTTFLMANAVSEFDGERTVFICTINKVKFYHFDKDCEKLSSCTANTEEITLTQAESRELILCDLEK